MRPFHKNIIDILLSGGVGVIPTDTMYGLVGRGDIPSTVERIYTIRNRNIHKPCIVLITSYDDLKKFNIEIPVEIRMFLETHAIWPGKVSIIFPSSDSRFDYLARGTKSIAFRMPNLPELRELLTETGPLIAPSANREGNPPPKTVDAVRVSFKDSVDFYVDGGKLDSLPSTLIKFEDNKVVVIREGAMVF